MELLEQLGKSGAWVDFTQGLDCRLLNEQNIKAINALKLKEISYIHAEGYPAAEMKHGPIALIDAEMPVVVIATQNGLYEKVLSNIQEIKARKGRVIAIVTKGDTVIGKIADICIELPETMECLDPLITTVPLQLLAYHIAVCKGMDVDRPRNLAKSVTVV